ncbi:hypothetical protein GXM_05780 [Nostoc sphaeroides CCNUC1]|uniref:Uncharacterized protein n=1 Tax=Nostoc sphaeroides CCNUC1 TaxID=2653204 RepID=A0A5P8W6D9_9NOSO|nr:hypothetical protein GXM_05780 [Nostoc sphaeroides CCNUC1]
MTAFFYFRSDRWGYRVNRSVVNDAKSFRRSGRWRAKIKGKRMNFAFLLILLPFLCT